MSGALDDFVDQVVESVKSVWRLDWRRQLNQVLNLGMIVFSALMLWKGLMVATGSESPIVVVLSGSMEPGFFRGDILFLHMGSAPLEVGEVVVFELEGKDIPIVHRILEIRQDSKGEMRILTKGDNNQGNDRSLYNRGQWWLKKSDVVGRVRGFLPHVGYVTILLNENPKYKWIVVALMGVFVLFSRDENR